MGIELVSGESFWHAFIWISAVCALFTTVRLSLSESLTYDLESSGGGYLNYAIYYLTHPLWCLPFYVYAAGMIGEIYRGSSSALPWEALSEEAALHGTESGLLAFLLTATLDLWLFWTAGQFWIIWKSDAEKRLRAAVRVINGLIGLLVVT